MKPFIPRLLLVIALPGLAGYAFFGSNGVSKRVANGSFERQARPMGGEEAKAWLFNQRAYPLGTIPAGATLNGWLASVQGSQRKFGELNGQIDHWTEIGPAPIIGGQINGPTANPRVTGRIVDIAVDPNQAATHWLIAAEGGGVWETWNSGENWSPRTDGDVVSTGISTIAIAPSNPQILFAGTHDINTRAIGLLKSTDGGASWVLQDPSTFPQQYFFRFTKVKVHPTDPNIVLAETWQGDQPLTGGVFKSVNGGMNFALKLVGAGTALEVDPTNFDRQYAAIRNVFDNSLQYHGIFRSLDAGENWTKLSGPWDASIAQAGGPVRIAVAPSAPGTLYVVVAGGGMWKTQNAWASPPTWTALPPAPGGFTQAYTTMVDPTDAAIFYVGGFSSLGFYRLNSNGTWNSIVNSTHVDQQAMAATGSTLLLGNDGGFWTSTDRGTTWNNKNSDLATVQFYAGSLHPTDALSALGGSQDNGTELWTGSVAWQFESGGDGGYSAFSASNPDTWLVSSQYLGIVRLRNGGTISEGGQNGLNATGAGFIAPIRRAPHGDIVLAGSDNLWKSTNFFTGPTPSWSSNSPEQGTTISAIAFAPSDTSSLTYAFGTGEGSLRSTISGGAQRWKDLDPPPGTVPNRYVKAIAYHPTDPATVYVALSGFDENTPGYPGHVFRTVNATAGTPTWTNVSPPVNLPINALAIDPGIPNTLYAGADLGVWKTTNGGSSWTFMGPASGMPNVPVFDLLFSPADGHLVAFTYGRGAFKLNVGFLQGFIAPAGAVNAGARWNVDGGAFQTSETIVGGLSPGLHTVSFSPAAEYSPPANQTVGINANWAIDVVGIYTPDPN
jgi:hypothetical protein